MGLGVDLLMDSFKYARSELLNLQKFIFNKDVKWYFNMAV